MAEPRSWGWHEFDRRWAEMLVAEAKIVPGTLVVDIGAGTGALTGPLLEAGARVIAVETHRGRAAQLRRRFGSAIVVVEADAADLRLPRRPYRVVANPPFAVTTPLLRRLLQPGTKLAGADMVLQDQAARRWASASAPGHARWGRVLPRPWGRRCQGPPSARRLMSKPWSCAFGSVCDGGSPTGVEAPGKVLTIFRWELRSAPAVHKTLRLY